jgi:hypothetical protein
MVIALVRTVSEKMKGFSRKETIAYYTDIMRRAWEQVQTAATPEMKAQLFDDNLDWTMLDKQFPDRTREIFSGPMVIPSPSWWGRYDPTFSRPTASSRGFEMPSAGSSTSSRPSLPGSDFAAGMVRGVEGFAAGIIGDITGFTGGVTNRTNPPPPPSTRTGGSSGGGGHSCACACACAGCACACAGGGR